MHFADTARTFLIAAGLTTIALSLGFDPNFATDILPPPSVPEPATATLAAIGGAAAVGASFIRRRRKK